MVLNNKHMFCYWLLYFGFWFCIKDNRFCRRGRCGFWFQLFFIWFLLSACFLMVWTLKFVQPVTHDPLLSYFLQTVQIIPADDSHFSQLNSFSHDSWKVCLRLSFSYRCCTSNCSCLVFAFLTEVHWYHQENATFISFFDNLTFSISQKTYDKKTYIVYPNTVPV